ncbi:MAG: hypothetical protein HY301_06160 [Verrucomicrobia bacterium]|nr:hypothetical protein [Verrucomicrobiota bacterium]
MKATLKITARLHVTIAYEDVASGKRAKELFDRIASILGGDFEIKTHMWKFDVLGIPQLLEMAVDDAKTSDVVVIASTNPSEPPPHVGEWIERWLPGQGEVRGALVSLCEIGSGNLFTLPAISSYCRRIARRVGMMFFCDRDPEVNADAGADYSEVIHRRADTVSPVIEQILHAATKSPVLAHP